MELRAFAQQVLRSTDLEEKLSSPDSFTDQAPGDALTVAGLPGRPRRLPLVPTAAVPPAPTPRSLVRKDVPGQTLHTFAHHELQALELMALALLRFPDAPTDFRQGLARIIQDEQRHFRLYQARAEHWGTGLGDVGASHFFWDTVAGIETPSAFLAALSLTYEQANLDFAQYWKAAFSQIDDPLTAGVLQEVYDDEIRHVQHGLTWFGRLSGATDFQTYREALVFPLSAGRGKGPIFDRAGREAAGFSPEFIDEMELSNVSRGRLPQVFSFDPFVEDHVAGREVKPSMRPLCRDLETVMMFLAHREDVVIGQRPSLTTLRRLHASGFEIPQFVDQASDLGERLIEKHQPWGWSEATAERLGEAWDPALGVLYDKTWAFEQRRRFTEKSTHPLLAPIQGQVCTRLSEVEAQVLGGDEWVVKAPLSTSGGHRIRIQGALDEAAHAWLERHLSLGPVLVEPWYQRLADLSVQVHITPERVKTVGTTRFWTTGSGSYRGAVIGRWTQGLPSPISRALHLGDAKAVLESQAHAVARSAQELGYEGPLGVDAMVVQTQAGIALVPILEVNPRYTMGRIAIGLGRFCAGHGGWFFLSRRQIEAAGYSSTETLMEAVDGLGFSAERRRLHSGVVFTTEPSTAERILTVLCVGSTQQKAAEQWERLGFSWPD